MEKKDSLYQTIHQEHLPNILSASNQKLLVLSFSADWSGNASMLDNIYKAVAEEFHNAVEFYRIDTDCSPELSNSFGVHNIPTSFVFSGNEMIERFEGVVSKKKVVQKINTLLNKKEQ